MNLMQALEFIKVTLEQISIASVKAIKGNIFTVKLQDDKVTVKNPTKLPSVFKVKEINPVSTSKQTQEQTRQLIEAFNKKFNEVQNLLKTLTPKTEVTISNLDEIEKPSNEVFIKNPVKSVAISNVYEINKELGKLQKLVQALKLDPKIVIPEIKLPTINIPQSKAEVILDRRETLMGDDPEKYIAVRLTNGKKFYEALEDFSIRASNASAAYVNKDGIKTQGMVDSQNNVLTSQSDRFGLNHTYKSGGTTYLGQEDIEENWIVQKIVKSGGTITMTYATKKNNTTINAYTYAWSHRADLEYGRYSEAF